MGGWLEDGVMYTERGVKAGEVLFIFQVQDYFFYYTLDPQYIIALRGRKISRIK